MSDGENDQTKVYVELPEVVTPFLLPEDEMQFAKVLVQDLRHLSHMLVVPHAAHTTMPDVHACRHLSAAVERAADPTSKIFQTILTFRMRMKNK